MKMNHKEISSRLRLNISRLKNSEYSDSYITLLYVYHCSHSIREVVSKLSSTLDPVGVSNLFCSAGLGFRTKLGSFIFADESVHFHY